MELHHDQATETASAEVAGAAERPATERAADDRVTLSLPPQPRYIRVARLVGSGLANELGYGVDRLDDVRLAIGEACALAVQAGAADLTVDYALDEHRLSVTLEAQLDGNHPLERDHVALVEQVLAVACSEHEFERDERRISARLVFSDGQ